MIMQPDTTLITIKDNCTLIEEFIKDMIVLPRINAHKWASITNQTPNLKIGYPAQHLASLITGMKGEATGARGNDIVDGSEVKSCSKVDQSDKCLHCESNVLRTDLSCPVCNSTNIKRNNDSKWLITIRNKDELNMALNETPRYIFLVTDYPNFDQNNYDDIRIRCFEIWVKSDRCKNFREMLTSYYNNIYLKHIEIDSKKTPAPKNLFPDNFPFYMCNPIKVFECTIHNSLGENGSIDITTYIEPHSDRSNLVSESMPISLLTKQEHIKIQEYCEKNNIQLDEYIDENLREQLSLRDTDKKIKVIGHKKHKK